MVHFPCLLQIRSGGGGPASRFPSLFLHRTCRRRGWFGAPSPSPLARQIQARGLGPRCALLAQLQISCQGGVVRGSFAGS